MREWRRPENGERLVATIDITRSLIEAAVPVERANELL
jgi:hypothetical protein